MLQLLLGKFRDSPTGIGASLWTDAHTDTHGRTDRLLCRNSYLHYNVLGVITHVTHGQNQNKQKSQNTSPNFLDTWCKNVRNHP